MAVEPDCVCVIPPNHDMSILHGVLHLLKPDAPRGLRLPIDFFFRSLAEDRQERSIGVILSGMGSDGTAGLRAIKENAGLALVQDPPRPSSTACPGTSSTPDWPIWWPRWKNCPQKLIDLIRRHTRSFVPPVAPLEDKTQGGLRKKSFSYCARRPAMIFPCTRRTRLCLQLSGAWCSSDRSDYVLRPFSARKLPGNGDSVQGASIGVTSFFRDPATWEILGENAFPLLLKECPPNSTLRAWSAVAPRGKSLRIPRHCLRGNRGPLGAGFRNQTAYFRYRPGQGRHRQRPVRASIRQVSPRMFLLNAWAAFSFRTDTVIGLARRSGK